MRKFFITFAVAVFIGLIKAQVATEANKQEAIQNMAPIPTFATPSYQAGINKKMSD